MRISRILFTNTPMEELEDDTGSIFTSLDNNETCYLCRQGFSLTIKKFNCSNCKMPVCLKNSIYFDEKSRICDNCLHESLVEEIWSEKRPYKDQIIRNMQRSMKEATEKEEIIKLEELRIESLKREIADFQIKAEMEEILLQAEMEKLLSDNDATEKKLAKISVKSEDPELITIEKIAKAQELLQIRKIEIEEALQDGQGFEETLARVEEVKDILDLQEVKDTLCKICWGKINKNPRKRALSDISGKICNCELF